MSAIFPLYVRKLSQREPVNACASRCDTLYALGEKISDISDISGLGRRPSRGAGGRPERAEKPTYARVSLYCRFRPQPIAVPRLFRLKMVQIKVDRTRPFAIGRAVRALSRAGRGVCFAARSALRLAAAAAVCRGRAGRAGAAFAEVVFRRALFQGWGRGPSPSGIRRQGARRPGNGARAGAVQSSWLRR
jgi:hypothetical protein